MDERDSLIAAALVLEDLARLGAPVELLAGAARVVEDEVRHTRVCAHVVTSFGDPPIHVDPRETRTHLAGPVPERLARLAILGFGVGEALSAASFASAREHCTEPIAQWAYTELLRDESRHAVFGIEAGAFALEQCPSGFAETLWPGAVTEMKAMESRVGGPFDDEAIVRERANEAVPTLERLGLLRGSHSCAAFHRAIERWIVPRLTSIGVLTDTHRVTRE